MDYARASAAAPVAALPVPDMSGHGEDWQAAKAAIDKLPEAVRGKARDQYADMVVAKEREGGGAGQTTGDYVRRFVGRTGLGGWAGEANAALTAATGGDYEMASAYERAKERAISATPTPKLGTLPLIGDVTAGGLTEVAGAVAGGLAMPVARVMGGAGALPTAVNLGATGAIYGGIEGAGNAEPGHTVDDGLKAAAISGAIAAPLGAVVGRFLNPRTPNAANVPSNLTGRTVAEASENLALPVPHSIAGGPTEQRVAQGLKQVPGAGRPITDAEGRLFEGVSRTADNIADAYAPGVAGRGLEPEAAGTAVRDAIAGWMGGAPGGSREALNRLYAPVDHLVAATPRARGRANANLYPLTQTAHIATDLAALDQRNATQTFAPILARVEDALTRRGGLEWDGIRGLRTSIRDLLDDRVNPLSPTANAGAQRLYDALGTDIRVGLAASDRARGGRAALPLWERANNAAAIVARRREQLETIIGARGDRSGTDVLDRIIRLAGSASTADTAKLRIAMAAMGPEGRQAVASAAVHRLGRNQADEFSGAMFFKNYSARSDRGKDLLFGQIGGPGPRGNLRQRLDDTQTLLEQINHAGQLRNTSNTAGTSLVGGTLLGVAGGTLGIVGAVQAALTGYGMARVLARPVEVQHLNTGLQQIRNAMTMGGAGMNEGVMRGLHAVSRVVGGH